MSIRCSDDLKIEGFPAEHRITLLCRFTLVQVANDTDEQGSAILLPLRDGRDGSGVCQAVAEIPCDKPPRSKLMGERQSNP